MRSLSLMVSVYPFATIRARTFCCFGRSTHLDSTMLDHCSVVSVLPSISVWTPCSFICCISFFIPVATFVGSSPSVPCSMGSSSILSFSISCGSSFDVVSTRLPSRPLIVIALILILRCGCSPVVGLSLTRAPVDVFCCLLALPSVASSGSGLVDDVGVGSAGRCVIGGAVAIGDVGSCVLCCFLGEPSSFCSPVLSLPSDDALVVASLRCFAACCCRCGSGSVVGVVVVGIVGVVSADAGVFHGPMLITSKSCWLYLCGLICRRIVRARINLVVYPYQGFACCCILPKPYSIEEAWF